MYTSEIVNDFPLKSEIKQGCCTFTLPVQNHPEGPS